MKCILLLDSGKSAESIAEYLVLSHNSLANHLKRYQEGGIEELLSDDYQGKELRLNETQRRYQRKPKEELRLSFCESSKKSLLQAEKNQLFIMLMVPTANITLIAVKKGQHKEIKTNTGRQGVNINGVVNAHNPTDL